MTAIRKPPAPRISARDRELLEDVTEFIHTEYGQWWFEIRGDRMLELLLLGAQCDARARKGKGKRNG